MEELAVGTSAHLIDDSGLKVHKDGPGDMLAGTGLTEECVECIVRDPNCAITEYETTESVKNWIGRTQCTDLSTACTFCSLRVSDFRVYNFISRLPILIPFAQLLWF